jgi:hypothetical protein
MAYETDGCFYFDGYIKTYCLVFLIYFSLCSFIYDIDWGISGGNSTLYFNDAFFL